MSAPEPLGSRTATTDSLLVRMGFQDRSEAVRRIALPELDLKGDPTLLGVFGDAADPDLALASLTALAEVADAKELRAALQRSEVFRRRLIAVLGASQALGEYLLRHPADWKLLEKDAGAPDSPHFLRAAMLEAVGANADEAEPVADDAGATTYDRLRVEYRRWLLRLAARDLTGGAELEAVVGGAGRPGRGDPGGGAGDRSGRSAGRRRAVQARRDRDGQSRRPRAELRQRRRRGLRG